jgi:hypothetical protein
MLKSGLVSITFRKLSPAQIVGLVAEAGLDGIEWGGDIHVPHGSIPRAEEVRGITEDAGLSIPAYGSYYRVGHSEKDGLAFERVLETAHALGAKTIRVWAGMRGSRDADSAYRASVASELLRIGALAHLAGLSITLEMHEGTLTDTNDSTIALLNEARHPSILTGWQPHNGMSFDYCLSGLQQVLPRLSNLHVFHWLFGPAVRLPLAEGAAHWKTYLKVAKSPTGARYALLEFVADDLPENFLRDAGILRRWLETLEG